MTSDQRDTEDIVDICRNYWRFDHSQQHTHSWHDREDFLRDHLVPFLRQHEKLRRERDDATTDRDRLAAIVEQIPTTKDGVRVGIADRVFSYEPSAGKVVARVPIGKGGSFTTCLAEIASLSQSWRVPSYREVSECYSTREAAEAAAEETNK